VFNMTHNSTKLHK